MKANDNKLIYVLITAIVCLIIGFISGRLSVSTTNEITTEGEVSEENESAELADTFTYTDGYGNIKVESLDNKANLCEYDKDGFVNDGTNLAYTESGYTTRLGVDVSYHQDDIDWAKVADAGYEFAIIRVGYRGSTQGGLVMDENFYSYADGAYSAGLDIGCYFFSQAVNEEEAVEESNFVLNAIKGMHISMPVVYDPELVEGSSNRTSNMTRDEYTKCAIAFCNTIKNGGYDAMIYSNLDWEINNFDMSELTDYDFWYADYKNTPQSPYAFTIWQASESATVPGINGNMDIDLEIKKQ